ncbi:CvpA family protein [Rhodobacterales bacterium HKCCE3408]|nr:CvpA family protein [Rhodobacterales bacterium HKCCE3408]
MEGFTIIDGIVAAVILVSAVLAYTRGFVRELLAIGGWIVAAIVAFLFAADAQPLIREIPYVGDFIGESCELGIIAAFAVIFVAALVVVSLFTPMFSGAIQRSRVGGVDAGLGFLFGVARGVLLVIVVLVAYDRLAGDERIEIVDNSRTAQIFADAKDSIEQQIPEDAPGWVLERYEQLTSSCALPDTAPTTAPAPTEEAPATDG